jgi:hypothetical protein
MATIDSRREQMFPKHAFLTDTVQALPGYASSHAAKTIAA